MLDEKPFWPISGGSCVVYWKSVGAVPGSAVLAADHRGHAVVARDAGERVGRRAQDRVVEDVELRVHAHHVGDVHVGSRRSRRFAPPMFLVRAVPPPPLTRDTATEVNAWRATNRGERGREAGRRSSRRGGSRAARCCSPARGRSRACSRRARAGSRRPRRSAACSCSGRGRRRAARGRRGVLLGRLLGRALFLLAPAGCGVMPRRRERQSAGAHLGGGAGGPAAARGRRPAQSERARVTRSSRRGRRRTARRGRRPSPRGEGRPPCGRARPGVASRR